jgi:hypothetical protein
MSGFSAGAHFAHMMSIIHSATVRGAGVLHGVPYIEWDKKNEKNECLDCESDPQVIAAIATENAITNSNAGTIDDISNLS